MVTTVDAAPHPILAATAAVHVALDGVSDADPIYMAPTDQAAALEALTRALGRVVELRGRVIQASDGSHAFVDATSATEVAGWLAHITHLGRRHRRCVRAPRRPIRLTRSASPSTPCPPTSIQPPSRRRSTPDSLVDESDSIHADDS